MPILTLTTDWGLRDHYLASFKGKILSLIPSIQMVDISNEVGKFNTMQAAHIVQNSYKCFPEGSIHFVSVAGTENLTIENSLLIIRTNGHYFIGEDNGIFTMILGNGEKEIFRLQQKTRSDRKEYCNSIVEAICKIMEGVPLNKIGVVETQLEEIYFALPTVDSATIRGTIIYIDSFGNAIVNIPKEMFENEKRGRKFIIQLRKATYDVTKISMSYNDVEVGEILALFNQDGLLEIALNKESASKLLGLKLMDPIRVDFNDSQAG